MPDGVPIVMVQCGVVAAWAVHVAGGWGLATALLVAGAVNGFDWFGRVAGSVITEAPGTAPGCRRPVGSRAAATSCTSRRRRATSWPATPRHRHRGSNDPLRTL